MKTTTNSPYQHRVIVERWDAETQTISTVVNRVYKTHKGASAAAVRYTLPSQDLRTIIRTEIKGAR